MKGIGSYITPVKAQFSGDSTTFEEAAYVVFGVPYDKTSTYRLGSKLGPNAIREASLNIETYSLRTDSYIEDAKICDLGNIKVAEGLGHITEVASSILQANKIPVILGGEHTLTYYVAKALPEETAIISLDAHYDLRDEYGGRRLSHATVMRRIVDEGGPERMIFVGTRAACKEERAFLVKNEIRNITARQALYDGWHKTTKSIRDYIQEFSRYYITLDVDVLDPAQAPGVGNPEPEGIDIMLLLDILQGFCDERLVGLDVVEVAPNYDYGITAVQAAKIIFEVLCFIETRKKLHKKGGAAE